jgi:hypothetical protein
MQNVATHSRVPQINVDLEYSAAQKSRLIKQLQILNTNVTVYHMQLISKLLNKSSREIWLMEMDLCNPAITIYSYRCTTVRIIYHDEKSLKNIHTSRRTIMNYIL